jgi:hypothetical protein
VQRGDLDGRNQHRNGRVGVVVLSLGWRGLCFRSRSAIAGKVLGWRRLFVSLSCLLNISPTSTKSSKTIPLTSKDRGLEILSNRRSILLQVPLVIIERTFLFHSLQFSRILDHFGVEMVDVGVWDYILDYDEAVEVDLADCDFEVSRVEFLVLVFGFGGFDYDGRGG